MLRRVVSLYLMLALAFSATVVDVGSAWAQADKRPSIRDELTGGAQKDWDSAKELYEAGDYQGALIQFRRAYEVSQNPRVLFNVGVCEKNLRHYANAISAWRRQLELKDKLTPEDEKSLQDAIASVEAFVSTLAVTSNEEDATLFINGQEIGKTPITSPVPIDVGRQEVVLKKEGFLDKSVTVEVARGVPATVDLKLEPAKKVSRVSIAVTGAPGATIFVDGTDMGPAPFTGEVPVGRHTFEARSTGFETARQTSEVKLNEALSLTLALTETRNEGKVKITTGHTDAVIEIDGRVVGSGAWEGVLKAGGHQLVVKKDGYEDYRSDIALDRDQVRTVAVSLEQDKGSTWIWWTLGTVAIVAGGGVASYFVFRPAESSPVTGTLNPGLVPARWP